MSAGRLFQSQGPAVANDRSPTVTRRDGLQVGWKTSQCGVAIIHCHTPLPKLTVRLLNKDWIDSLILPIK